ncbi:MAG: ribonucleoside-diphosphate reductase [Proteobacteria bacterium]|nr:MAG: ribonucleoside-diphosphate reductase [Pseudomonadota bacterium]
MLLDHGMDLTLRPMKYPAFYEMYKSAIKNTWTVEEVDFTNDVADLRDKLSPAESHLIKRLVAFFATGDSIVSNNLVLNLYKHINSPEARMYLSRQLYEEAVHVQFYLTLLDTYLPNDEERVAAFSAIENIPSMDQVRREEPELFDDDLRKDIVRMMDEAVECEMNFSRDVLGQGIAGLSEKDMRSYLEYVADQRLSTLGIQPVYHSKNPFSFMELQDVQELTNFFERRVVAYQMGVTGEVSFNEDF